MKVYLSELIIYFIIYSVLGWILESVYRSYCERRIINSGFLRGPICPIYGIGANIIILFLSFLENRPILLFISSVVIMSLWEYIVGFLLEKIFKTKYWDYSDHRFNINGRICLFNSICWGILGVLFVKYIHPFVKGIVFTIDRQIVYYCTLIIGIVFLVDFITSVIKMINLKATLKKIEDLNSEIREKVKEITNLRKEKDENKLARIENIQKIIENLKKKRNRILLNVYKNVRRLKKAFPAINTKEITEILSKKIELLPKKMKSKNKN